MKKQIPLKLFIPEFKGKKIEGFLTFENNNWEIITKNSFSRKFVFEEHKVIYGQNPESKKKYSFVNCFTRYASKELYIYVINEIYEDEWIRTSQEKKYFGASIRLTHLELWDINRLIKFISSNEEKSLYELKEKIIDSFRVNKTLNLSIIKHIKWQRDLNKFHCEEVSEIFFENKKKVSRKQILEDAILFKNFFNLFTTTPIHFKYLNLLNSEKKEIKVDFNFHKTEKEDRFNILIERKEIEADLNNILPKLYSKKNELNEVIQLFVQSYLLTNMQLSFLSIAKGIELYHKAFKEVNNKILLKELATKIKSEFDSFTHKKVNPVWSFNIRLYHLHTILKNFDSYSSNPVFNIAFIERLYHSRNYYTHLFEKNKYLWDNTELNNANIHLRIFLRTLILNEIGVKKEIIEKLIKTEVKRFGHIKDEKNEYSIFK